MKNLNKIILSSLFVLAAMFSYGQTAVSYMEKITLESKKIQSDMWDYTNAISHGKSARKVEKTRESLLLTSRQALNRVKGMKDFNGSTTYRDSVVSFLTINYLVLKEDYAAIVDMEEIKEQSYDNMEAYLMAQKAANTKMQKSAIMVGEQQAVFAEANDITLITDDNDELTKKMEIAGEVYDYYNEIYLIFFKSYIQETYLVAAMVNNDVSGIEQNKNALKSTANEGLALLKNMGSFNGDKTVITACSNLLKFYKNEAENKIDAITDYYLKSENFASVEESFNQIKQKNRTQEDVDRFNNAANEVNEAVKVFNETNDFLNKERAEKIEAWNKAVAKFTDKHVPH